MIISMTAFARKQHDCEQGSLIWEIRSVNHRYLEPGIRLPDMFRALEPDVRDTLRKQVSRGKVECQLRWQHQSLQQDASSSLQLNTSLLDRLKALSGSVSQTIPEAAPISVGELLPWPGMLQEPEPDVETLNATAMNLFQETLSDFNEARKREGKELAGFIQQRLDAITTIVAEVRRLMPDILIRQHENLLGRLDEIEADLDPLRLEQEAVLLAQKADVDEELDRLETHLIEVRRCLSVEEPVGRRLDFLMQELNREANTLSSKSIVSETTLRAVDLKVLIEQMREQVQNIE